MKKLIAMAVMAVVGVGVAAASSIAVPWFIDFAPPRTGVPSTTGQSGVTGIVTLKSNRPAGEAPLVLSIQYFSGAGDLLGPFAPDNTFTIEPQSALAFRPVVTDPGPQSTYTIDPDTGELVRCTNEQGDFVNCGGVNLNGQEGDQGVLVPTRPRSANNQTPIEGHPDGLIDTGVNGSITISWEGDPTDIQGQVSYFQTRVEPNGALTTMSYAHLLPTGV